MDQEKGQDAQEQTHKIEQEQIIRRLALEIGRDLVQFLSAPDWQTSFQILDAAPLLLVYSANELIEIMADASHKANDEEEEIRLRAHLAVLGLVRRQTLEAVKQMLARPEEE